MVVLAVALTDPCIMCFRYWCKLPEVKQKEQEQRRESQAATNRLRMKLYQQVSDMRQIHKSNVCESFTNSSPYYIESSRKIKKTEEMKKKQQTRTLIDSFVVKQCPT